MKTLPRAIFFLLTLAVAAPLAALEILSPFRPFGPIDPALLLDPESEPPAAAVAFEGRLVDVAGEPVAGAEAIVRWVYPPADTFDPETAEAMEEAEGLADAEAVEAEADAEIAEVDAGADDGEVVDPVAEGEGGEGAEAGWEEPYEIPVTRHARSDAQGFFRFTDLDPGQWLTLEVAASGFVRRSFDLGLLGEGNFPQVFELERGGGVVFEVVNEKGEPLASARAATAEPSESYLLGMPLVSDPTTEEWIRARGDGVFRLEGLAGGASSLILVAPGYRSKVVSIDVPLRKEPLELGKIWLEPAGKLRGRVLNRDGEPVVGASVQVHLPVGYEAFPGYLVGEMSETDAKGKFEMDDKLPEGIGFEVVATAEGYGHARVALDSPPRQPLELHIGGRRRVYGQVVGKVDRAPVAGCELFTSVEGPGMGIGDFDSATADAGGHFELAQAPEGPFTLHFNCGEQYLTAQVDEDVELPLTLEVPAVTFVRGRILRQEEAAEDELASVIFKDRSGEVDEEGNFSVEGFEPGSGILTVSQGETNVNQTLEVPLEGLEGVEVHLPKKSAMGRVEGRVYDPWGKQANSAWVQIYSGGILLATAMSLPDGSYQTSPLEKGSYRVVGQWQERYFESTVEVDDEVQELDVHFPDGATVRGRVRGLTAGEWGRLDVRALRQHGAGTSEAFTESIKAETDAGGGFTIDKVPPGTWQLRATVFGRRVSAEAELEVSSTGIEVVNLELAPSQ